MKRIVVLGSTGSIGTSCLDVIRAHSGRMTPIALCAHSRWQELAAQCVEFQPRFAVVADDKLRGNVDLSAFGSQTEVLFGLDAVMRIAADPEADIVVSGIVGAAGLQGTWAALDAGKTVALANKETLVVGGGLITDLARRRGAALLPVDSEHGAVFQALQCGRRDEVQRIILTASGGPFRTWSRERIENVTPAMALDHPTWRMGPKITIDSASMMNKALEVIEARWLFDLAVSQIDVVVHPQSIVHSMVEFIDGSVVAHLSPPDMKLPIQYALTWPERAAGVSPRMNFRESLSLEFEPPDLERFPALALGFEVAERGGTCGAVLNAANETAVQRFLRGDLPFPGIADACCEILNAHQFDPNPTLERLLQLDGWAREETLRWKSPVSV